MCLISIRKGNRFKCLNSIYNLLGQPLYIEGKVYNVLDNEDGEIALNHVLYANEYMPVSKRFVRENFKKLYSKVDDDENLTWFGNRIRQSINTFRKDK